MRRSQTTNGRVIGMPRSATRNPRVDRGGACVLLDARHHGGITLDIRKARREQCHMAPQILCWSGGVDDREHISGSRWLVAADRSPLFSRKPTENRVQCPYF